MYEITKDINVKTESSYVYYDLDINNKPFLINIDNTSSDSQIQLEAYTDYEKGYTDTDYIIKDIKEAKREAETEAETDLDNILREINLYKHLYIKLPKNENIFSEDKYNNINNKFKNFMSYRLIFDIFEKIRDNIDDDIVVLLNFNTLTKELLPNDDTDQDIEDIAKEINITYNRNSKKNNKNSALARIKDATDKYFDEATVKKIKHLFKQLKYKKDNNDVEEENNGDENNDDWNQENNHDEDEDYENYLRNKKY